MVGCETHTKVIVCDYPGLLDLAKDEYTFGRGEECDHVFVQTNGKVNPQFSTFSKVHFILYLVRKSSLEASYVFYWLASLTHRREIKQISTNTLHLFKTRGGCGLARAEVLLSPMAHAVPTAHS